MFPRAPGGSLPGQGGLPAEKCGHRGCPWPGASSGLPVRFVWGAAEEEKEGRPAPLAALTFPARSRAAAAAARVFCELSV